jgi:hypothetical protein
MPKKFEPTPSMLALLEDDECLTRVTHLTFGRNVEFVAPLISKGTITKMNCKILDERIQGLLDEHPGNLLSLRCVFHDQQAPLLSFIALKPGTYCNLVSLGEIQSSFRSVSEILHADTR